jgi:hypothetical protein
LSMISQDKPNGQKLNDGWQRELDCDELASRGWPIFPLCFPNYLHRCGCGHNHLSRDIGKAPLTRHGNKDATTDPDTIRQWLTRYGDPNWGIDLSGAGLLVIAPDSPQWLAKFQENGLPPTVTIQSGGGEGHQHFYYQRPEGCPIHRSCRTGEYDILSNGYVVAPPSMHQSGNRYQWVRRPLLHDPLPLAPAWAVDMLIAAKTPTVAPQAVPRVVIANGNPPVTLSQNALGWWNGTTAKTTGKGIDRSATLFTIGLVLAGAGATESQITAALRERDITLGLEKYSTRPEERSEKAFRDIATKALGASRTSTRPAQRDLSKVVRRAGYE